MQPNQKILPIEKIISVISYFSMGIIGLFWIILANMLHKKLKYFLMYNIVQSMLISVFLAAFKLILDIVLSILSIIPFIDSILAVFNWFISVKVISIFYFSFSILELLIFTLICYISIGVIIGRIFYIPILTDLINKIMKNYEW